MTSFPSDNKYTSGGIAPALGTAFLFMSLNARLPMAEIALSMAVGVDFMISETKAGIAPALAMASWLASLYARLPVLYEYLIDMSI